MDRSGKEITPELWALWNSKLPAAYKYVPGGRTKRGRIYVPRLTKAPRRKISRLMKNGNTLLEMIENEPKQT